MTDQIYTFTVCVDTFSDCCNAPEYRETGLCSECMEHAQFYSEKELEELENE